MTVTDVMLQLAAFGSDGTKRIYLNHGAKEPLFGVKVGDMKKILKQTKTNHELALQLFDTGNSDAMYLAGLMADEKKITKQQLQAWAQKANWYLISESVVGALAAESPHALELAREWIKSNQEMVATAGWSAYAGYISLQDERRLDLQEIENLLDHVGDNIHRAPNRVRYAMNGFVIGVGGYVGALTEKAVAISKKIGKVSVNMGNTACKVPFAPEYIEKMIAHGSLTKRKTAVRC